MSTTSKQDRQGSRTPADLERKYDLGSMGDRFAEVMGIALDAQTHSEAALDAIEQTNGVVANISEEVDRISITVKDLDNVTSAEFLIGVINGQSTAKISADKLDIAGKKLNIKVDATNIVGKLTASQISVKNLSDMGATVGGWEIESDRLSHFWREIYEYDDANIDFYDITDYESTFTPNELYFLQNNYFSDNSWSAVSSLRLSALGITWDLGDEDLSNTVDDAKHYIMTIVSGGVTYGVRPNVRTGVLVLEEKQY